jgi:hypothetical protein
MLPSRLNVCFERIVSECDNEGKGDPEEEQVPEEEGTVLEEEVPPGQ